MSKSRANKQNRLRAQIKRQRNDVYKFKGRKKVAGISTNKLERSECIC